MLKNIVIIIFLVCVSIGICGADEPFVYDDHDKRDPLWHLITPSGVIMHYDSDLLISDMVLEGIISDPGGENLAIVNGKIIKRNDKIGLYVVLSVEKNKILLKKGQENFILKLKKEE